MEVANVYNQIANDFSKTRYSVWSGVKKFLDTLPSNSSNIDIGCGNGKNMLYRDDITFTGLDISTEMVDICQSRGLNCITGDILHLPWDDNSFDNAISIAVIHHLETKEKRLKAIQEIFRIIKPNGKLLISVWSLKQPDNSKRKFTKPDEMVPFHNKDGSIHYRYYHLYQENELLEEVKIALKDNKDHQYEIDDLWEELGNYYVIINKK